MRAGSFKTCGVHRGQACSGCAHSRRTAGATYSGSLPFVIVAICGAVGFMQMENAAGRQAAGAPDSHELPVAHPDILRDGGGEERKAKNQLELKPFDAALWGELTDPSSGAPVTAEALRGKVVLVVNWAEWLPAGRQALTLAQQLAKSKGPAGLVVVSAHDGRRYAEGLAFARENAPDVITARDATSAFRTGLRCVQSPEFILVDRAGTLRFLDIERASVAAGVDLLLAESAAQAAEFPAAWKRRHLDSLFAAGRTRSMDHPVVMPVVEPPFTRPPQSIYDVQVWPRRSADLSNSGGAPSFVIAATDRWLTPPPATLEGRVVIIHAWNSGAGRVERSFDVLNDIQTTYPDDVVVIHISTGEPEQATRRYVRDHKTQGYHVYDARQDRVASMGLPVPQRNVSGDAVLASQTVAIVLSTDKAARHLGNVTEESFRRATDQILAVDPGIKARRAARKASGQ